jgi:hypothetical protein
MRFVRVFKSGGEDYDPRQHRVAEWACDVCKYVHWEGHINEATLDKMAKKKCPKCGSYSVQDRINALKLRKTELDKEQIRIQQEKTNVQKEIEKIYFETEKIEIMGS